MPTKIGTEVTISAAHFVQTTEGKCKNLHGHNWRFEVEVDGKVREDGMVIDFNKIKDEIKQLDHKVMVPSLSPLVVIEEFKRKYYKIKVKKFYNPNDPTVEDIPVEPEVVKEYVIPMSEVVRVQVTEITAENLAEVISKSMKETHEIDAIVRVYESDTSWAQFPSECD